MSESEFYEPDFSRQAEFKPLIENEIDQFLLTYDELRRPSSPWVQMDSISTLIHDPLPEVPNFGIFHLSVVESAALIAADFTPQNETLDAEYFGRDPLAAEKALHEVRKMVIKQFVVRIMRAIEQGALAPVFKIVDRKKFIAGTDDPLSPARIYINFPELLDWLCHNGYAKFSDMEDHRYMWNYCCAEYGLAAEIEGYIKMRRESLLMSSSDDLSENLDSSPIGMELSPEVLLNEAMTKIRYLQKQLQESMRSKAQDVESLLSTRERETAATVLLAVCKLKGVNLDSRETGSQIQGMTERLGVPLAQNTVDKWLKDATNAFKNIEEKRKEKYARANRPK